MRKAFVIIRVSSQDQLKGYGPNVQWLDDVIPNAPLLGLEVSEEYKRVIQESATTWERTKFEGLMREALALYGKNEIGALLFPRVDRETRFIFGSFPLLCEVAFGLLDSEPLPESPQRFPSPPVYAKNSLTYHSVIRRISSGHSCWSAYHRKRRRLLS